MQDVREAYEIEDRRLPSLFALLRNRNLGLAMICYPVLFHRLLWMLPLLVFAKNLLRFPFAYNMKLLREYLGERLFGRRRAGLGIESKSLRKTVSNDLGTLPGDSQAMESLRAGR